MPRLWQSTGDIGIPSLLSEDDVESNVHAFLPRHAIEKFLGVAEEAM